jgi:hypothetical protein
VTGNRVPSIVSTVLRRVPLHCSTGPSGEAAQSVRSYAGVRVGGTVKRLDTPAR